MKTNNYDIHVSSVSERDKIISFIDNHWKHNHALVQSKELFDFQHYNKTNKTYNFVIAVNDKSQEIDGLYGFIPTYQYDEQLNKECDYWGAIWKKRDDVRNDEIKLLGLTLFTSLFELPNFHSFGVIGISDIAKKIYKAYDLHVDSMNQYYIANPQMDEYHICKNPKCSVPTESDYNVKKISLDSINAVPDCVYKPVKSIEFIKNRYAKHPIYKYEFYGIYKGEALLAIFVIRKVFVGDSSCIRIVDVLGDLSRVGNISKDLMEILKEENSEYIDFVNYGINDAVFENMGFNKLDIDDEATVIPNYFEPFVQKNIKLNFAYKADFDYVIFKADGDQDRPSII